MSEDYRSGRNRADEWAYCATRKMAVAAAGIIVGALTVGAIAIVARIVMLVWGVAL